MLRILKRISTERNIDAKSKLITDINVEYPENELLYNSLWTKNTRVNIKKKLLRVISESIFFGYKRDNLNSTISNVYDSPNPTKLDITLEIIDEMAKNLDSGKVVDENENRARNLKAYIREVKYDLTKIKEYLESDMIIINGDGATGKTHLLTKLNDDLLDEGELSIIFYGQTVFDFDKYISYLNQAYKIDLLKDMSKYAKDNNKKAVLIFDAINEARISDKVTIIRSLKDISDKYGIKIIVSYRNGDIDSNTHDMIKKYPSMTLYGFSDEVEAAVVFSEKYGIDISEILEMDFSRNPLILKIFCEHYNMNGLEKGQRGFLAATYFFEHYFIDISNIIIKELGIVMKKDNSKIGGVILWNQIAKAMAKQMVDKFLDYIEYRDLSHIISSIGLNVSADRLLDKLVVHKLLERIPINYKPLKYGYKFSFQKQSDFLIARELLNSKTETQKWEDFLSMKSTINYLKDYNTVLETLVEHIPIRTGKELYHYYSEIDFYNFNSTYLRGLKYRSEKSLGKDVVSKQREILDFFKNRKTSEMDEEIWLESLSSSMLVTYHPLNMYFYLSPLLDSFKNNDRDMFLFDFVESHYDRKRFISLLKLPYYSAKTKFSKPFKVNLILLYFWLLSMSDREMRDKATKSIVRLSITDLELLTILIKKIEVVDDQYIIERLFQCVYSSHVIIANDKALTTHMKMIRRLDLSKSIDNSRIRHYLVLLERVAHKRGVISDPREFDYYGKTKISLSEKSVEEIKVLLKDDIEHSRVFSSLFALGDFGRYQVESRVSSFKMDYTKELDEAKLLLNGFVESLHNDKQDLYSKYIDKGRTENLLKIIKSIQNSEDETGSIDFRKVLEMERETKSPKEIFLDSLSEEEKSEYNRLESNVRLNTRQNLKTDTALVTIVEIMFNIGYDLIIERYDNKVSRHNYYGDRHEHKIERLGKKYQWIALFNFLTFCITNLDIDEDSWRDYHSIIGIDIDSIKVLPNEKTNYDFYELFTSAINKASIDWDKEDFITNYDNISILNEVSFIEYDNAQWVPIFISSNVKNEELGLEYFFRVNTLHLHKTINTFNSDVLYSLSQGLDGYDYTHTIQEMIDLEVTEEENDDLTFNRLWRESHIESEYDYSNIGMTIEDKDPFYYVLIKSIQESLKLEYNYAGLYYDKNRKIAAIQSPFDAEPSYLYIRKDLIDKVVNEDNSLIAVYSQKSESYNSERSFSDLGSEFDAAYILKDDKYIMMGLHKRNKHNYNE